MNPRTIMHPEDAKALLQLESIPELPQITKKILEKINEPMVRGENLANNIRLSSSQHPEIYSLLPPICQELGIDEPELFLKLDPYPNAWTFGDTKPYITITSGMVGLMDTEGIRAVIAHECGHILCHHSLYLTLASVLLKQSGNLIGGITKPLIYALLYWQRRSELSADRVSALITSPETVTGMLSYLAGGTKEITSQTNIDEWHKQVDEYEKYRKGNNWNKILQTLAILPQNHPFTTVRVHEIMEWAKTSQYKMLKDGKKFPSPICPRCRSAISYEWHYCQNCGLEIQ